MTDLIAPHRARSMKERAEIALACVRKISEEACQAGRPRRPRKIIPFSEGETA